MPSNIIESFDITVNDLITINEYGEASCRRIYKFQNHSGEPLPVENLLWKESFPLGTSEFYLIRNGERINLPRRSQLVEIPIISEQTIEPNGSVEVPIEYKWTNFAKIMDKNLVFLYSFQSALTKVTLKLKFELLPPSKTLSKIIYYLCKESKGHSNVHELKSKGSIIEGQFDNIDLVNLTGFYYHGFKWWVECVKLIVYGIIGIIIFEKYLRNLIL